MIIYRITKNDHAALDGTGGLYGPGRWHRKGHLIIYASEYASLAAWEKIVHVASFGNLQNDLLLVKLEIPDRIEIQTVPQNILVKGWDRFPYSSETVNFGTSFLRKKEYLALKVPTVIIPDEFNVILNPLHPDIIACKVISIIPFIFDTRVSKDNS
jgi:RES domain-containing protein